MTGHALVRVQQLLATALAPGSCGTGCPLLIPYRCTNPTSWEELPLWGWLVVFLLWLQSRPINGHREAPCRLADLDCDSRGF